MAKNNSELLIASLVAIVAVVGLVILFKGGSTGEVINPEAWTCPPGQTAAYGPASSGLTCTPSIITSQGHSSFDRPYGHSGEWRTFEYPGT